MALDTEFLSGVFNSEEGTIESKIQQIITEYNADINGLKTKNQELIGKEKNYKQTIQDYETGKSNFEKQIEELTNQIKSKSDDKTKEYYEAQLKAQLEGFGKEKETLLNQIADLNKYKLNDIKNKQVEEGIKGITFVNDVMKNAFLSLAMSTEQFEPTDIDGQMIFLNKDKKNMSDVLKELALSEMGRNFIANGISGGGGVSNANKPLGNMTENPFKTGNLDEQTRIYRENKSLAIQLAKEAGINLE